MKNAIFVGAGLMLLSVVGSAQVQESKDAVRVAAQPQLPLQPPVTQMVYRLAEGNEGWDAEKRRQIVAAMDAAVTLYNQIGEFDKKVVASYNVGIPTADGNYNGNIRFGGQIGKRTALHELGHVLGVGTHPRWNSMLVEGKWTGTHALSQLRAFDGPEAVLHGDRQHFWPYGLNYDKESSPENDRRHVLMVAAFRRDLGIVNNANVQAAPTRRQNP